MQEGPSAGDANAFNFKTVYDRVARLARVGVWECELPSEELIWTDTIYDLFGLPRGAKLRRSDVLKLYEPRSLAEMERRRADAIREGTGFSVDVLIRPVDGGERWIRITGDVESENGRTVRIFGTKQDITLEKQAQERVQALQNELIHLSRESAMNMMASSLAHELKQPLSMVASYTEAARRLGRTEGSSAELMDAIDHANASAHRAGEIIRRLRAMVANRDAQKQKIDLAEVVKEAVLLATAGQEDVLAILRFEDVPSISADPIQIQQVLINLIKNACEASSAMQCTIEITAVQKTTEVELRVADSGPGIPPDLLPRLFEPFVSTKEGGMGVGLAIVRTIIESHGGRIFARNRSHRGAEFCITLPC